MPEDTRLIKAVLGGDITKVLPLITIESINAKGELGKTALHNAVLFVSTPETVVSALLNHGANINAFDDAGRTPLSDAGKGARTIDDVYARRACQLIERGAVWPDTPLGKSAWRKLPSVVQQLFTDKLLAYQQQQEQLEAEEKAKAFGILSKYVEHIQPNTPLSLTSVAFPPGLHHRSVELKTIK